MLLVLDPLMASRYTATLQRLGDTVAKTPNFSFEKQQREKLKAAKKAAKADAKAARKPAHETPAAEASEK